MPAATEAETELAALERIASAVAEHDLAGLIDALEAERQHLAYGGRAASQLSNLLTVLKLAPAAFAREREKLDAQLNPPEAPAVMPGPGDDGDAPE